MRDTLSFMRGRSFDARHALVVAFCGASLLVAFGAHASDAHANDADDEPSRSPSNPIPTACTPPIKCCRVCTTGKACGKTCIQESKVCHKGKGCACNAADVCAEDP